MANLREIRTRIGSVKKTRQITAAMKLVAGARLKRATDRANAAKPYKEQLSDTLGRVAARAGGNISDPLLERRPEVKRLVLVLLTSDRGLCGAFNNTLMRRTLDWLDERQKAGQQVDIVVYGRKGGDFLKGRKIETADRVVDYGKTPKMEVVKAISSRALSAFTANEADEIWLGYNKFKNVLVQQPTFEQIVPVRVPEGTDDGGSTFDYLYEPAPAEIVGRLLPLFLRTQILQALLETEAGEYAARMTAMDNATRNASDLIDRLTREYNRARQAAITTEITEIVSGAEALN